MTCLSQSLKCRGELFTLNERSFATLHHSDFANASSYSKSNRLSHKFAIRYFLYCKKKKKKSSMSSSFMQPKV